MPDRGAEVTEAHRLAQARLAAAAALGTLDRWRQVSPTDLEAGSEAWLRAEVAAARVHRRRSRELTADYVRLLRAFRTGSTLPPIGPGPRAAPVSLAELREDFSARAGTRIAPAAGDSATVTVDDFDWPKEDEEAADRAATVSLVTTGPVRAQRGVTALQQRAERGRLDDADFLAELDSVMRDAGASAAGAAGREAQRGGRDLMEASSRADRAVIGWARVTDSDPCWFCAMLASRGAVYRNLWTARYRGQTGRKGRTGSMPDGWEDWSPEQLADWETRQGLNRYHDNCHCTLIPVYSRADWVPEASRAFRELYSEVTEGLNAQEARAAFRAAMEARQQRARARGVAVR